MAITMLRMLCAFALVPWLIATAPASKGAFVSEATGTVNAWARDEYVAPKPLRSHPTGVIDKAEMLSGASRGFAEYKVGPNSLHLKAEGDSPSEAAGIHHSGGVASAAWKDSLRADNPHLIYLGPTLAVVVLEYEVHGTTNLAFNSTDRTSWTLRVGGVTKTGGELHGGGLVSTYSTREKIRVRVPDNRLNQFGEPDGGLDFSISLKVDVNATTIGYAESDYSETGKLSGIYVTDANGNPIDGVTFTSASGYVYAVNPPPDPLDADFDLDDDVDGNDVLAWQRGMGLTLDATRGDGDADHDDDVDGADLLVWKQHFGSSAQQTAAPVPEPATSLLFVVAATVVRHLSGRQRQKLVNA